MTFRENIIIFFVPLQIAFTDCGTSEAIVDPKTDSFTDCGTQEPLWTQNCYFKCCFCACFFTAYYYLWKYPRCRSFLPKKIKKNNVIPDNDRLSTCYFFFLCYRDLCLSFFLSRYLIIVIAVRFIVIAAPLHFLLSSLLTVHRQPP